MQTAALLVTALLFGGMVLFSAGFAAFLFSVLSPAAAGKALRQAFPHFYLFVMASSAAGSALVLTRDGLSAGLLAAIFLSTVPARQILMPAINRATDTGAKARFKWLHGLSVLVTFSHIILSGWVLTQIPGLAA